MCFTHTAHRTSDQSDLTAQPKPSRSYSPGFMWGIDHTWCLSVCDKTLSCAQIRKRLLFFFFFCQPATCTVIGSEGGSLARVGGPLARTAGALCGMGKLLPFGARVVGGNEVGGRAAGGSEDRHVLGRERDSRARRPEVASPPHSSQAGRESSSSLPWDVGWSQPGESLHGLLLGQASGLGGPEMVGTRSPGLQQCGTHLGPLGCGGFVVFLCLRQVNVFTVEYLCHLMLSATLLSFCPPDLKEVSYPSTRLASLM